MPGLAAVSRSPDRASHRPRVRAQHSKLHPARLLPTSQPPLLLIRTLCFARHEGSVMNRKRIAALLLLILSSVLFEARAQVNSKALAEKLGLPRDAKLLIVHADDVGVTHSVNAATIKALDSGLVNSASIMVPCPWFPEIADYARAHPEIDFGLHLTLTSERVYYRWGPVASKDKVPSLVDENGYFHHDWATAAKINPKEVELELRAQIERAYAMGVRPTHFDSHQYRLYENGKDLFEVVLR